MGKISISTGRFFLWHKVKEFFPYFYSFPYFYCFGDQFLAVVMNFIIFFCIFVSQTELYFSLRRQKGKYKESRRKWNILSAHFEWEVFIPELICYPVSEDNFQEWRLFFFFFVNGVLGRLGERNSATFNFAFYIQWITRVKRKNSQGRAGLPFYRVMTPFFSFWDAIVWIWNSIMYMQLNDLKTLQFPIVWVPRKVILKFDFNKMTILLNCNLFFWESHKYCYF